MSGWTEDQLRELANASTDDDDSCVELLLVAGPDYRDMYVSIDSRRARDGDHDLGRCVLGEWGHSYLMDLPSSIWREVGRRSG